MNFKLLETVVLARDVPEHGLQAGDLGTVVEVYESDGLEIEFLTADGRTQAVLTLEVEDVREVRREDILAVRSLQPTG